VSRATGHRFGGYLPRALPLVVACYRGAGEGEADDELRDACLQVGGRDGGPAAGVWG
jgi:hypothetical protein